MNTNNDSYARNEQSELRLKTMMTAKMRKTMTAIMSNDSYDE